MLLGRTTQPTRVVRCLPVRRLTSEPKPKPPNEFDLMSPEYGAVPGATWPVDPQFYEVQLAAKLDKVKRLFADMRMPKIVDVRKLLVFFASFMSNTRCSVLDRWAIECGASSVLAETKINTTM